MPIDACWLFWLQLSNRCFCFVFCNPYSNATFPDGRKLRLTGWTHVPPGTQLAHNWHTISCFFCQWDVVFHLKRVLPHGQLTPWWMWTSFPQLLQRVWGRAHCPWQLGLFLRLFWDACGYELSGRWFTKSPSYPKSCISAGNSEICVFTEPVFCSFSTVVRPQLMELNVSFVIYLGEHTGSALQRYVSWGMSAIIRSLMTEIPCPVYSMPNVLL